MQVYLPFLDPTLVDRSRESDCKPHGRDTNSNYRLSVLQDMMPAIDQLQAITVFKKWLDAHFGLGKELDSWNAWGCGCTRSDLRLLRKDTMRIAEKLQTYHSWDRANVVGLAMLVQLELS